MKLKLYRDVLMPDYTTGKLDVDGSFFCYILEDTDRKLEENPEAKEYGKTAIPRGTYEVILDYSNRFKRVLPRLLNVPGYSGVRIHPGNTAADTEGCLLPGSSRNGNFVSNSRHTFTKLYDLMEEAYERGEPISLEVV